MRYSTTFLDEVRERVPLSSIVGRHVQWDKRKTNTTKRDYWACCPFHGEKSPSFHADDRKGIYHCFGCGVTGDAFRFLVEIERKTFPEAVEELANQAGIALPQETPESRQQAARRLTLVEANERAAVWFQQQLTASRETMAYAVGRGITPQEIAKYRLGFAPDGNMLKNAGLGDQRDLIDAGLLGEGDGRVYDRFRNRLMFPILNAKGQAVAFSGRAMGKDQEPKYLNSPETEIFNKGTMLYNGAAAREKAWSGAQLVLVEGQIDVIAANRVGLIVAQDDPNAVARNIAAAAPMGTAFTEDHVKLMMKASDSPVLCFDGDAAGRKAADKAIDLILPYVGPTFTARFAVLPEGQDPDTMVKRSPSAFADAITGASSLADALWRRETSFLQLAVPEQRAKLEQNLRTALQKIADRDTRRAYGQDFKDRLQSVGQRQKVYRSNSYSQHSTAPSSGRLVHGFQRVAGFSLRESILISAIAAAPHAALDQAEELTADGRLSREALELIGKLVLEMSKAPDATISEVLDATGLTDVVADAMGRANAAGVDLQIGSEADAALSILSNTRRH